MISYLEKPKANKHFLRSYLEKPKETQTFVEVIRLHQMARQAPVDEWVLRQVRRQRGLAHKKKRQASVEKTMLRQVHRQRDLAQ